MASRLLRQAVDYLRSGINARARIGEQDDPDAAKLTASLAHAWLELADDARTLAEIESISPQETRQRLARIQQLTERAHHARDMVRMEPDPERKKTLSEYALHLEAQAATLATAESGQPEPQRST